MIVCTSVCTSVGLIVSLSICMSVSVDPKTARVAAEFILHLRKGQHSVNRSKVIFHV